MMLKSLRLCPLLRSYIVKFNVGSISHGFHQIVEEGTIGLLDTTSHQYYSTNMDLNRTVERLMRYQTTMLYDAIREDLKEGEEMETYLQEIDEHISQSLSSANQGVGLMKPDPKLAQNDNIIKTPGRAGYTIRTDSHSSLKSSSYDSSVNSSDAINPLLQDPFHSDPPSGHVQSYNTNQYLDYLALTLHTPGMIQFLSGGDSSGKSLLLQSFKELTRSSPVNLSMTSPIVSAATKEQQEEQNSLGSKLSKLIPNIIKKQSTPFNKSSSASSSAPHHEDQILYLHARIDRPPIHTCIQDSIYKLLSHLSPETHSHLFQTILQVGASVLDKAVQKTITTDVNLFKTLQQSLTNIFVNTPHGLEKILLVLLDSDIPLKVIVLDHAHEYFLPQTTTASGTMTAGKKAEETSGVASSVDVLEVLLGLCKTQQRISLILSTSSSSFPYDLFEQTGINILPYLDASLFMVADMPPYEARHYLREEWKVREHLHDVLVQYFGGDVVLLRNVLLTFLTSIRRQAETVQATGSYFSSPTRAAYSMLFGYNAAYEEGLLKCHFTLSKQLQRKENTNIMEEFFVILQSLARVGFVILYREHIIAKLLLQEGIAVYIPSTAIVPHLPLNIRQGQSGIIPVKQSVRVTIAKFLLANQHLNTAPTTSNTAT